MPAHNSHIFLGDHHSRVERGNDSKVTLANTVVFPFIDKVGVSPDVDRGDPDLVEAVCQVVQFVMLVTASVGRQAAVWGNMWCNG